MRVAFFHAYHPKREYQVSLPPLGLGYLMAYLKRHQAAADLVFCRTEAELLDSRADVVAISSASENFGDARRAARAVRDNTAAVIVGGGSHISALPHTLPDGFDFGVLGEGEQTFLDLLALLTHRPKPSPADLAKIPGLCHHANGKIVLTSQRDAIEDLDTLPYPDREGLGRHWRVPYSRTVHMISSRGCPYRCTFCASARLWKGFRSFSSQYVVGEIEHVRERYDPREIHFFDDLFIVNRKRLRDFCRLLEQRGLHRHLVFRSYARADLIDDEMADLMARHNFRYVDFGIESGCRAVLEYLGKHGVTPEQNQRAIDLLTARGISVGVSMIIGSPAETREQMEETYAFLDRNRNKIDRMGVGLLMPLPGTPVWDAAARRRLVDDDMEWDRLGIDFETADVSRCPILSEQLDAAELAQVFRRFNHLEHLVNARGEVRRLTEENALLMRELETLRSELESLKGSRAVQAALKVRQLTQRLRGLNPSPGTRVEPWHP